MAGRYQAYPEYKDSGAEWLGRIPKGWLIAELKRYSKVQGGFAFNSDLFIPEGEPVIRIGDIKQDGSISLKGCRCVSSKIAEQYKQFSVSFGELVMAMTGATIGKAGWYREDEPALVNQRVGVFKCDGKVINYRYLWYILNSFGYQEHIRLTAFGGAQPNISETGLLAYKSGIPSIKDQCQVCRFLDHETAKIDTLIEKQLQLIQLLKEKRQAVISHAVTKGLNPDAPMRDSGVEWFESIPEHWKASKLGFCCKISNGATPARDNLAYWDNGTIGWLNSSKINDVSIYEADQYITQLAVSQTSVQPVKENDILIAITGEGQTRGRVAICKMKATINQHMASISIGTPYLDCHFLFYWLTSQYERIRFESTGAGSTKGAITCRDIASYPLPIPPLKEQLDINSYIQKIECRLNSLIALSIDQINLLNERRTALISAAVTGKIDVRNWQPQGER